MRCINCESNDWENIDEFRIKPQGMHICKTCGFISYPNKWATTEDIKKYYHSNYRQPPNSQNLFSGQKKLQYHMNFLEEYFERWNKKETFVITDVGAAFGMFLTWFKSVVPKAELNGTEWDLAFRRNAYHEYNIRLTEDFDDTKKYDMISLYKVAEHQIDFDLQLKKYIECLNDKGVIYISVPIWFDMFYNFGPCNNDIEYYYHPDHINQWTRKIFQSILKKCGLKIIKENFTYYDDTYLCVKDDDFDPSKIEIQKEDINEIKEKMKNIKQSYIYYADRKYKESIEAYPNNPLAWKANYELNRKQFHELGMSKIEEYMQQAAAACPNSCEIIAMCADIMMRYNKFDRAIDFWKSAVSMRPGAAAYFSNVAHCFRKLYEKSKDEKEIIEARNICRLIAKTSTEHLAEALNWIYNDNAKINIPDILVEPKEI